MKLAQPSVVRIVESDPLTQIENAARTCYKSESNKSAGSAKRMFDNLVKNKHTAMLEHASLVFQVFDTDYYDALKHNLSKYMNFTEHWIISKADSRYTTPRFLMSGNIRAINDSCIRQIYEAMIQAGLSDLLYPDRYPKENENWPNDELLPNTKIKVVDISEIEDLSESEKLNHVYKSFRIKTDRAVSHEIVRHRTMSFAQQSQRYVKYNSDDIEFVEPSWYRSSTDDIKEIFNDSLLQAEKSYNELMSKGCTAQEARCVLPNSTATEIVVTGNLKAWKHFINLRYKGTTGKPYPDMKTISEQIYNELKVDSLCKDVIE